MVEVTLPEGRSLPLEEYGDLKSLGRVCLRDRGLTVAVGVVTRVIE